MRADAGRPPFADAERFAIATIMTATDFDNLASVLTEARRVAMDGGPLVVVIAHPCFGQVFEEGHEDGSVTVFPGYREHRWFEDHPLLGEGIRRRVGTMNVPLPALLNAMSDVGWHLERTEEDTWTTAVPILLGVRGRALDR